MAERSTAEQVGAGENGDGGAAGAATAGDDELRLAEAVTQTCRRLREQIGKVIVGQDEVVEQLLIALLARGHCLMQGVPGLAKTLLVSTLARATALSFRRIQFTPDLMPGDITGTEILQEDVETGRRRFEFAAGPIFTHILLADEINRTPPKTQSALLQAMQERQVTVGTRTFDLPDPFFVLATQNPIEQEGTYPLPEAQQDRFMLMVLVGYPRREQELEILRRTTGEGLGAVEAVVDGPQLLAFQSLVRRVPVGDEALELAADLVRATRPDGPEATDFVRHWLSWGAGPRAGQSLVLAAKARALIQGRLYVALEDIEAVARPVLRHRLVPNFNAEAEGIVVDQIIDKVLSIVPRGGGRRLL
ncbi:MAG: AAA family ATPase [Tepidisphaerales bacterium]